VVFRSLISSYLDPRSARAGADSEGAMTLAHGQAVTRLQPCYSSNR
jgi:hypothetical protein